MMSLIPVVDKCTNTKVIVCWELYLYHFASHPDSHE